MSGIEVVGLISAIVGVVEAIGKVSKALKDAKDVPRAFHEVAERLPLVQGTLQSVESHISNDADEGVYKAMKKVLENCREKGEQLEEIFKAVAPSEKISRIKRYALAVRRLGKGSLVEILAKGMMEDAHLLVLAHSAQAATETQVVELSEAIRELSTIEASLPEEGAVSQAHFGSGDNIAGSKYAGNHNEFSGSGTAYFAPVTQHVYSEKQTELGLSQLCFRSLVFEEMDSRPTEIKTAEAGTCRWILKHKIYQTWEYRDRSLLWIKGKPGSGKSTLLRYARDNITSPRKGEKPFVLSFFFNGRGSELQKTPDGLFRSLLCQLQSTTPEALGALEAKFKQRATTLGAHGERWTWKTSELRYYAEISLWKALETLPILLFVDALDECGEENAQNLAEEFSSLLQKPSPPNLKQFRICFTCRHYPILNFDGASEICIDTENEKDISLFVETKLHSFQERTGSKIAEYISKHAEGVFLWACLVVKKALSLERERIGIERIETEVRLVPQTLDTLYSEFLRQLHPDSFDLIECICFASKPLTLAELHWAVNLAKNPALQSLQEFEGDLKFRFNAAAMEWEVKTLGHGLIEYKTKQGVVQFIHQSVKDFFVEKALPSLRNSIGREQKASLAHYRFAQICLRYLEMLKLDQAASKEDCSRFPFLSYAADSWVFHVSQIPENLQESFPWPSDATINWWWHHDDLPVNKIFRLLTVQEMTLFNLIVSNGWIGALRGILARTDGFDVNAHPKGLAYETPLHITAMFGYVAVSALLLEHGAWSDEEDLLMKTPLHIAAEGGHAAVLELLLESGVRLDPEDVSGRTPLSTAIENGDVAVIELLLKKGADVNYIYEVGFRRLTSAIFHQREWTTVLPRVLSLLAIGAPFLGYEGDILSTLIYGAHVYQKLIKPTKKLKNPLSKAVELGDEKVVQLLLEYNAKPIEKETLLSRAIKKDSENGFCVCFVCASLLIENLGSIISKQEQQALCAALGRAFEADIIRWIMSFNYQSVCSVT